VSQRHQFGKPLAAFQQMLSDIIGMQLLCLRLAHLQDEGKADLSMASLAKLHTAAAARRVLADARGLLGGNGLLLDNHVARAPRR
jgi:glutaryl-CoA dehydrogenase